MNLLKKRGMSLRQGKIGKGSEVDKIEEEIAAKKDKDHEENRLPLTAFIIFENEEGAERAKAVKEGELEWMGQPMKFKSPPAPSDIIWENWHMDSGTQCFRRMFVILFAIVLLSITFIILLALKSYLNISKYASQVNCDEI